MKFEKSDFEIRMENGEYQKVSGLKYLIFGVHKSPNGNYNVTHLPTGFKVMSFYKQIQAKKFVQYLLNEEFPVSWYKGDRNQNFLEIVNSFYKNGSKVFELAEKVKSDFY